MKGVLSLKTSALMYHDVVRAQPDASGFRGQGPARYKLSWTRFVEHLDVIGQVVGRPPALAGDLRPDGHTPWLLTFDDGGVSASEIGEELARRGWHGHFFVTTGLIGQAGFLDAGAIRGLRENGHVIGSHSVSHPSRMASLSPEELRHEWQTSVAALSALLGEDVRTASIPGGRYSREVARAAGDAGVATLFTSEPVRMPRQIDRCVVIGRYSVRHDTSAHAAANAAGGHFLPWLGQYAGWNLRKPIKAVGGEHYLRARRFLLATRTRQ